MEGRGTAKETSFLVYTVSFLKTVPSATSACVLQVRIRKIVFIKKVHAEGTVLMTPAVAYYLL